MSEIKFNSAGVSAQDAASDSATTPTFSGIPAAFIGTSQKGPAFVPVSFGTFVDFINKFGDANVETSPLSMVDKKTMYGPLAVSEWLRIANNATYVRVLGVGDGKKRIQLGSLSGDVTNAGFTVGEQQPDHINLSGSLGHNFYANQGGVPGRTYFLGCFMSESVGSTIFNSAGLQGTGSINGIGLNTSVPIIRGILMAPSGVILKLSSSAPSQNSSQPPSSLIARENLANGTTLGSITLNDDGVSSEQFILLLNGHKGTTIFPNVITASLDYRSPIYITRVLNMTASLQQEAGHYLAANWDIHPSTAVLTGTGVVTAGAGLPSDSNRDFRKERSVFLITSSLQRDVGSSEVPNYENFRDRFSNAFTPWFISQKFFGKPIDLFRFHLLDSGAGFSKKYKIAIHDIVPQPVNSKYQYGTFSISVYDVIETDVDKPLEKYLNVTLDPSSDRFISKVIGDINSYFDFDRPDNSQKLVIEGNYPLRSRIMRVEVAKGVYEAETHPDALPLGFRGIYHLVTSGSKPLAPLNSNDSSALNVSTFLRNAVTPPLPFANNVNIVENQNSKATPSRRWGVKFDHITDLNEQNTNYVFNKSIDSFAQHYPNHSTINVNFSVGENSGISQTSAHGILDSDVFCHNLFTLENIKVTTGSNGYVDPSENWNLAAYIRNGDITTDDVKKTRRVSVDDLRNTSSRRFLSFYSMFQGGFDGVNIFEKNEYNLTNAAVVADMYDINRGRSSGPNVSAYLKALEILNDSTNVDMKLLAIPGIREPAVTDQAVSMVESRFDSMYVMDIEQVNSAGDLLDITKQQAYNGDLKPNVNSTIDTFISRGMNSSFAAAYFPDVVLRLDARYQVDSVEVPPSVVVMGALALNDSIGQPWFAPAGTTRGSLPNVLSTVVPLKENDLNLLYENDINPLYTPTNFSNKSSGVVVWGQKTLLKSASALDRINVRRLMIEIRRIARDIAIGLLFEQNRPATLNRFNSLMSSRLGAIQNSFGLQRYQVKVDTSTTTQSDIENNTIRGKILIQPTKTLEWLSQDFIISNGLSSEI